MSSNIRLTKTETEAIVTVFKKFFNSEDKIYLFGSRADPTKKGGDIDLYIETSIKDYDEAYEKKLKFIMKLQDIIGEQKIDVVLDLGIKQVLIYKIAKEEGVRLA